MKSHKGGSKYNLFKSNRSQASLLSNQSLQERGGSYQPSPIDSPLQSPAFLPPSAASSPLSPDDKSTDDSLARSYEADAANFYQSNHHGRNVLQRSQSHRTSPSPRSTLGPTINLVSPTNNAAGFPSVDEDPDKFYQNIQEAPAKSEHKKKRRFLGLGGSSEKEAIVTPALNSPRGLGRSISVRRAVGQPEHLTNTGNYSAQHHWPSGSTSAKFSSPTVDEESEGGDDLESSYGKNSRLTPPIPPKDPPKLPLVAPKQEQENTGNEGHPQYPTTASNRSHPTEQGGLRTSAWDRPARASNHHRNPSSDLAAQYQPYSAPASAGSASSHTLPSRSAQDLAYPQTLFSQNSRPSSRQSLEPPSPSYSQSQNQTFHQRTTSLQVGNTYSESSMGPPSAQSHVGNRSQEFNQQNIQQRSEPNYQTYGQGGQGSQGGAQPGPSGGQYGSQLGVNNGQQGGSYRNTPQASPMVLQNSNSEQGRNTPPPSRSRDDLSGLDMQQLNAKYDELSMSISCPASRVSKTLR